jgi:hypothetical protein
VQSKKCFKIILNLLSFPEVFLISDSYLNNQLLFDKDLKLSNHNQHTSMNMFIKQQLVSVPSLGHRQAETIQESEYMQKLKIKQ